MGTPPVDGAGFSLTGEAVFWSLCRLVLGAAVYWLTALDPSVAAMVSSRIDHQFDVCFVRPVLPGDDSKLAHSVFEFLCHVLEFDG